MKSLLFKNLLLFFIIIFLLFSCTLTLSLKAEKIKDYSHSQKVWIDFTTGESHGIKLTSPENTAISNIGGKRCASTSIRRKEQFIYFDIDDSFIYEGSYPIVNVTIEYYDLNKDAFNIHFDCKENFYSDNIYARRGKLIHKTDSKIWKRFTAHLTDARFSNRQKHHRLLFKKGADLRIHNKFDGSNEYVSFMEVSIPYLYVTTDKIGNIFKPGEDVSLQIKILNREEKERAFNLAYEIIGYNRNVIERNALRFKIPKNASLAKEINLKSTTKGIYFVDFVLKEDANILETAKISFAVCDDIDISSIDRYNSPFGVCVGLTDLLDEDILNLLEATGIGWARFEPMWEHLEIEKDKFRWEPYDKMVKSASKRGMNLYGLLGYRTEWANPTTGEADAINDFANYAYRLAKRYKNDIKFWEVWNEEDWMGFWKPKANPAIYTNLLKATSISAKKANPECKVIIGGLTGNYKARGFYKFLNGIYDNKGKPYFDIVAIHPYVAPLSPEQGDKLYNKIGDAYSRMCNFGDAAKKMWFTELGWPTGKGTTKEHVCNERNVNLEKQAQYLVRAHIIGLSSGIVERIFWYRFKNKGYDPDISQQNFGLINADLSPKPAYVTYRVMIGKIAGLDYVGRLDLEDSLRGYIFRNRNKKVQILWSTEGDKLLNLPIKNKAALITDIMGNTNIIEAKRGRVELFLTESPIFLEESE